MHWLFAIVRFLPYWALPLMLLCLELSWIYRRKGKAKQYYYGAIGVALFVLVTLWFYNRGDRHSDAWVRYIIGS